LSYAYDNFSNTIFDTRPSGGVTVLVHNNSPIPLTTTLKAQSTTD